LFYSVQSFACYILFLFLLFCKLFFFNLNKSPGNLKFITEHCAGEWDYTPSSSMTTIKNLTGFQKLE